MSRQNYGQGRRSQDGLKRVPDPNAARGRATAVTKARALVCTADPHVKKAVSMAGFEVTAAPTGREALPLLQNERWELVAMERNPDLDTRAFLGALSGERRRELFVLKVDDHFITNDRFQAWHESVDLVVHSYDLGNLKALVEEAHQDKIDFYRGFRQTQQDTPSRLGGHA